MEEPQAVTVEEQEPHAVIIQPLEEIIVVEMKKRPQSIVVLPVEEIVIVTPLEEIVVDSSGDQVVPVASEDVVPAVESAGLDDSDQVVPENNVMLSPARHRGSGEARGEGGSNPLPLPSKRSSPRAAA